MISARNENSVQYYVDVGNKHTENGAFGLAVIKFNDAERVAADDKSISKNQLAEIFYLRGLVRIQQNLPHAARDDFKRAQELYENDTNKGNALYQLGNAQFLCNDWKVAIENLNSALNFFKGNIKILADIYKKIGLAYHALDNFKDALDSFDQSGVYSGDISEITKIKAQTLMSYGNSLFESAPLKAVDCFTTALPYLPEQQKTYYSQMISEALLRKGKQCAEANEHALAINHFITALNNATLANESREECVKFLLKSSFIEAKQFKKSSSFALGIDILNQAIQLTRKYYPHNLNDIAKCYYKVARLYEKIYMNTKNPTEKAAIEKLIFENYKFVIYMLPKHDRSEIKGLSYLYLANLTGSTKHYLKAFTLVLNEKMRGMGYHDLALNFQRTKDYSLAIEYFEKSAALFKKNAHFGYAALSHTNKATCHHKLKQYGHAVTHSRQALSLWDDEEIAGNPTKKYKKSLRAALHVRLANSHLMLQEYGAAISASEEAISLYKSCLEEKKTEKNVSFYKDSIASCYLMMGFACLSLENKNEAQRNILLSLDFSSEVIKGLDNKDLFNIIKNIPECYDLIEVYLSEKQRVLAQQIKSSLAPNVKEVSRENLFAPSVSKLASETSVSKSDFPQKPKSHLFFQPCVNSSPQEDKYQPLEQPKKAQAWWSRWKNNKIMATSQRSITHSVSTSRLSKIN